MKPADKIKLNIIECYRCELAPKVTAPVPFASPPEPEFVVMGEAPGRIEDLQGEPFVGPSGMFLRGWLRRVGLSPEDAAFFNAVSCFPSGPPSDFTRKACKIHMRAQLRLLAGGKPLLCCGRVALETLLPEAKTYWAQGQVAAAHGALIFPVRHPAAVMRNRSNLREWTTYLWSFAELVRSGTWTNHRCYYCHRPPISGADATCFNHTKNFAKDSKYRPPRIKTHQETLF